MAWEGKQRMREIVRAVVEYNAEGALVWAENLPGAFSRGQSEQAALMKLPEAANRFRLWSENKPFVLPPRVEVVERHHTALCVREADSEVIFESEKQPLSGEEYERLRSLVLRSAADFERLYQSIPDKNVTDIPPRNTFLGILPRTAREMYEHVNCVTAYYVGEVGTAWENRPDMLENRQGALKILEKTDRFLELPAVQGSFQEWWSVRKVMRRFLWHDRIHARAMYRMACRMWGVAEDVFYFSR